MLRATSLSIAMLALCACGSRDPAPQAAGAAAPDARSATAVAGNHAFQDAITAGDFAAHVQELASNGFAGRPNHRPINKPTTTSATAPRTIHTRFDQAFTRPEFP